jgi:hypothetical protein
MALGLAFGPSHYLVRYHLKKVGIKKKNKNLDADSAIYRG